MFLLFVLVSLERTSPSGKELRPIKVFANNQQVGSLILRFAEKKDKKESAHWDAEVYLLETTDNEKGSTEQEEHRATLVGRTVCEAPFVLSEDTVAELTESVLTIQKFGHELTVSLTLPRVLAECLDELRLSCSEYREKRRQSLEPMEVVALKRKACQRRRNSCSFSLGSQEEPNEHSFSPSISPSPSSSAYSTAEEKKTVFTKERIQLLSFVVLMLFAVMPCIGLVLVFFYFKLAEK